MNENERMVLYLLAEGKISADDAARLLFLLKEQRDAVAECVTTGRN